MLSNQVEGKIIEQGSKWDDHTNVTWVYEGVDVIYFSQAREKANMMWIFLDYLKTYHTRTYH
jgi:hypothetical protein